MPGPSADAPRIFTGIARSYDRAGAVFSFGQDPRWRRALVADLDARPNDLVLDVATGTGLVAAELARRYGCRVVGLDRSADMLAAAARRDGLISGLVNGRAERLPFADATFDHVTFTYLLRYVDDPAATLRELARVLKPGGRLASAEFGVPSSLAFALWRVYTRAVMPLLGRLLSRKWSEVNAFLGPSIERFYREHPQRSVERYWREAGLADVRSRRMSLGGGIVMSATKLEAAPATAARLGPAFYSLRPGGPRDYWTLLHPPYTAWHLSYVLLGAALSPAPDPRIVLGALLAFALGVGVAAHSFDELRGRPLATRIPARVLVALGTLGLAGATALGLLGVTLIGPAFAVFVAVGIALVLLYALEAPLVHTDIGFALSWGAFPVLTTAYATGAPPIPAIAVAAGAALLSLAQRVLSTRVRAIRRRSISVEGEIRYRDGSREIIGAGGLIAASEGALRILWLAVVALSVGLLLSRYV
ncbi:MAG TPA: class I SAM-dependent methyltransferase [Candidatus Limnocylindria bacterium]|nr:class I SAM-dependent methyltransferase [Candidatus Limnocylindria bacterium]